MRRETFILIAMPALFALGFILGKKSNKDPSGVPDGNDRVVFQQDGKLKKSRGSTFQSKPTSSRVVYNPGTERTDRFQGDIEQALMQAIDEPNLMKRLSVLAGLLGELNEDNLDEVLAAFEKIPVSFETMQEYRLLMYAWGQFDAPSAIQFMRKKASGGPAIWFSASAAMSGWSAQDPQAAIDWANEQDDRRMMGSYNMGIVSGWVTKDVKAAAEYVTSLDRSRETGRMLSTVSTEMLKQGRQVATAWAEGLGDEGFKEDAFRSLTRSMAREDVDGVADWLQKHVNQKYSDDSFDELAEQWSRQDPEASLNYFLSLPEGSSQKEGVIESVQTWFHKDVEAAGEWINKQDPGSSTDLAVFSYAREVARENPESAVEWAASIQDSDLKQKGLVEVGQRWFREDAEAAKAWLPNSGLPEEAVKAVQNPPRHDWRGGGRGSGGGGR